MGQLLEVPRIGVDQMRILYAHSQPKKPKQPDPTVQRDLKHGWLLDYLLPLEYHAWGRWVYWGEVQMNCSLPEAPIPRIDFLGSPHDVGAAEGRKMLIRCLNAVAGEHLSGDGWMGWSSFRYFDYFLDWLLFGFGHPGYEQLPSEETPGASMRLYQLFDLSALLLWPYDHFGDMLAECSHGRHNGFFPTPQCVVEMMVQMTRGVDSEGNNEDTRAKSVCDCACGTGRMLLHSSNHSLRLFGQDIDKTMCKTSLVNGYLYAPWLPRPIWWMDSETLRLGNALLMQPGEPMNAAPQAEREALAAHRRAVGLAKALRLIIDGGPTCKNEMLHDVEAPDVAALAQRSEQMIAEAPSLIQGQLFDTEFDAEGTKETAPILKRKKRVAAADEGSAQLDLLSAQLNLLEV